MVLPCNVYCIDTKTGKPWEVLKTLEDCRYVVFYDGQWQAIFVVETDAYEYVEAKSGSNDWKPGWLNHREEQ